MSYEQKPNMGVAFSNKYKTSPSHPDMKGDIYIDRSLLKSLMEKTDEDLIRVAIAVWVGTSKNGNPYHSFKMSEPYVKKEEPKASPPTEDEDVPF